MKRPLSMVCLVFMIVTALYLYAVPPASFDADALEGGNVMISGIVDRITYKNEKQVLYLDHVNCDSSQTELYSELRKFKEVSCICYMTEKTECRVGSRVFVSGDICALQTASNPGEFDYRNYCAVEHIYFSLQKAEVYAAGQSYDIVRETLSAIRQKGCAVLDSFLNEADAGIMRAMILGDRTALDQTDRSLFQQSGISHILAISGLHISLIGMGVYRLLSKLRLPRGINMICCILLMILYGMMTGMSSSAFRAILMFAIRLNAGRIGRTYDMLTALSVSAVCLVIEQPLYVFYAGFQLSFGAVIGLACVEPALEQLYGRGGKGICGRMRRSLYAGFSIAVITFPVLLYHYYEYSLYSVFFNLIVLPTVGAAAGSGFLILLLGSVCPVMAKLPALVCSLIFKCYRVGGRQLLKLPGAVWIAGRPKGYAIICYAAGILLFLAVSAYAGKQMRSGGRVRMGKQAHSGGRVRMGKQTRSGGLVRFGKRSCGGIGIAILVLSVLVLTVPVQRGITITFLDVGQGDGVCIRQKNGHGILIDCGSTDQSRLTEYRLEPFLKSQGIHTLDAVFLSHLDADHTSGVLGLLADPESGIRIRRILLAKALPKDEAWEELVRASEESGVEICYMQSGECFANDTLSFTCLFPVGEEAETDDRNKASMILLLGYGSFQAVFTGDADASGELQAISAFDGSFSCELLKVAHHGSASSSSEAFLNFLRPEVAVISCGEHNSYGHPAEQTLARLEAAGVFYLTTMEHGAVTVWTDGRQYRVETYR